MIGFNDTKGSEPEDIVTVPTKTCCPMSVSDAIDGTRRNPMGWDAGVGVGLHSSVAACRRPGRTFSCVAVLALLRGQPHTWRTFPFLDIVRKVA